ncbi:MAG: riboflavin synthase [Syntrophobacterales bacterium]|nr:riboflavin synthase [Syntrophobacterales bacterium]
MFTGLVEGMGVVRRIESTGGSGGSWDRRIEVEPLFEVEVLSIGESISIDGVCLTVVSWNGTVFRADVSTETLSRSTLGDRKPGDLVNLERALKVGDRLGGHLVMGHVDCVGVFKKRLEEGRSLRLFFEIPDRFSRYVVEKGSVAVNGVSLTVNGCSGNRFDVNIIPHTAMVTNIGLLKPGDRVNIETDIIGKYVERILLAWKREDNRSSAEGKSVITEDFLKLHGFLK